MKTNRFQISGVLALVLLALFGCAGQTDETPVAIDNITTERVTYSSEVSIGDRSFIKETTAEFRISGEGELLSSEVLSRTLDGIEMEQVDDGSWTVSVIMGSSQVTTQTAVGSPGLVSPDSEDCDTEYHHIMSVSGNVVPFGEGVCIYSVTETCWLFGYDSQGIYTAVMTVDDYFDTGECGLDRE